MRAPIAVLAALLPLAAACAPPSPVPPTIEIAPASSAARAEPDPPPAAAAPGRRAEHQPGATSDEDLALSSPASPPRTTLPPSPPNPQLVQAREAFKHGVELYSSGNYRDAVSAFLSAYQILPKPQILFNAATAALQGGDLALACRLFAQWKQDASPSPAELARASELVQRCP